MGFSILVCIFLMGVPLGPTPPFGNFSGEIVYDSAEASFNLEGTYNLYECEKPPSAIQLRLILDDAERSIEVDRAGSCFFGRLNLGSATNEKVEIQLVVDGRVVAASEILLSGEFDPSVKIIRFTSLSPPV